MRLMLVLVLSLVGCSFNSPKESNRACSDMPRCCGCGSGMGHCLKNKDGSTCCTPERCMCKAAAGR